VIWPVANPICVEAIRYLDIHPVLPDGTSKDFSDSWYSVLVPLLLNSALCALKLPSPASPSTYNAQQAVKSTTRAINLSDYTLSPQDKGKALYRRALAELVLKQEDDAERDLTEALTAVPGDDAIQKELIKVKAKKKEKRDKEKAAYKNMFSS
jgi:peptidyl-prolyl isomerase D